MQANQLCLLSALSAREFHQHKVDQGISLVSVENHSKAVEMYDILISDFYKNPVNGSSIQFLIDNGFITKKEGFITNKGKVEVSQDPNHMHKKDLGIKTLFNLIALVKRNLLDETVQHFSDDMLNNLLSSVLMEITIRAEQREFKLSEFALDAAAGMVVMAYPQAVLTPEVPVVQTLVPLEEEKEQEVINLAKPKKSRKKASKEVEA